MRAITKILIVIFFGFLIYYSQKPTSLDIGYDNNDARLQEVILTTDSVVLYDWYAGKYRYKKELDTLVRHPYINTYVTRKEKDSILEIHPIKTDLRKNYKISSQMTEDDVIDLIHQYSNDF